MNIIGWDMFNIVYFVIFHQNILGLHYFNSQKAVKISKKWKSVCKNMLIFAYYQQTVRDMTKLRSFATFKISKASKWMVGWYGCVEF